jgi:hypothetical protein
MYLYLLQVTTHNPETGDIWDESISVYPDKDQLEQAILRYATQSSVRMKILEGEFKPMHETVPEVKVFW